MPSPDEILPERVLESRRIYEGHIPNLRVDTVELAEGRQSTREVVEHGEVVAIVALDEGNAISGADLSKVASIIGTAC